jgi:hypothetical protein
MQKKNMVIISGFVLVLLVFIVLWLTQNPENRAKTSHIEVQDPKNPTVGLVQIEVGGPRDQVTLPVDEEHSLLIEELYDQKLPEFEGLRQSCLYRFPEFPGLPTEVELRHLLTHPGQHRVWTNLHLKNDQEEVYRVRTFMDDGPNGTIQRLVIYKEDEAGFPHILPIPEDERINPSPEIIARYMSLGEIIHREEAIGLEFNETDYFFEIHNDELIRLDITSELGHLNCQADYLP